MADEARVTCPVCEHEVGTKEDGTKIKAHKISGQRCGGSDELVILSGDEAEISSDGIEKGDSFEALESAQDDADESDEETDPETPEESETGTQGVASSTVATFVHTVKVHASCPYLDDQAWHAENAKMAARTAHRAGHVLAGGEAVMDSIDQSGDHLLVNYIVPVK